MKPLSHFVERRPLRNIDGAPRLSSQRETCVQSPLALLLCDEGPRARFGAESSLACAKHSYMCITINLELVDVEGEFEYQPADLFALSLITLSLDHAFQHLEELGEGNLGSISSMD